MPKRIVKTSESPDEHRFGKHRFEHWQVDNQVYFLTARCREKFPAFRGEAAKAIFWDRFGHWTAEHGFTPWVTSLLDNHYHTIGYLREGRQLPEMMRRIHGSIAKLVNDHLRATGVQAPWLTPEAAGGSPPGTLKQSKKFWGDSRGHEYFDGCLRDVKQGRLTYRYTLTQCRRHGICDHPADYPHTRVVVELERAIRRAVKLDAFLEGVPYPRYQRGDGR